MACKLERNVPCIHPYDVINQYGCPPPTGCTQYIGDKKTDDSNPCTYWGDCPNLELAQNGCRGCKYRRG